MGSEKMKKIFLVLILCVFILPINSLFSSTGWRFIPEHVKGGFKQCTVYNYKFIDGILDLNSKQSNEKFFYNNKGEIISEERFDPYDSNNNKKFVYYLDSVGNIIEELSYDFEGRIYCKYSFKYDSKGNEIEEICYSSDDFSNLKFNKITKEMVNEIDSADYSALTKLGFHYFYEYKYHKNKIIYKLSHYESYDKKTLYKYNNKGNLIEEIEYISDSSVYKKYNYKFNSKNQLIEFISYKGDSSIDYKETYQYNEKGDVILEVIYKKNNSINYQYKVKYDKYGNTIEKVRYNEINVLLDKIEYIYSK
jgi:hypothetical protein